MSDSAGCRGCGGKVRLGPGEVERILAAWLQEHPGPVAPPVERQRRLDLCHACPDLLAGSTCRHCGCLVAVRVHLADRACPHPAAPRWPALG